MALREGWLKRQFEAVERDIASWPRWMRSQACGTEEQIFLATPVYGGVPHSRIGIIAFTPQEACQKILEYYIERLRGSVPRFWSVRELQLIPKIEGVSVYKAAEVLIRTGTAVLHIEEERAGRACPIRVVPLPRSPRTIKRKIK